MVAVEEEGAVKAVNAKRLLASDRNRPRIRATVAPQPTKVARPLGKVSEDLRRMNDGKSRNWEPPRMRWKN